MRVFLLVGCSVAAATKISRRWLVRACLDISISYNTTVGVSLTEKKALVAKARTEWNPQIPCRRSHTLSGGLAFGSSVSKSLKDRGGRSASTGAFAFGHCRRSNSPPPSCTWMWGGRALRTFGTPSATLRSCSANAERTFLFT